MSSMCLIHWENCNYIYSRHTQHTNIKIRTRKITCRSTCTSLQQSGEWRMSKVVTRGYSHILKYLKYNIIIAPKFEIWLRRRRYTCITGYIFRSLSRGYIFYSLSPEYIFYSFCRLDIFSIVCHLDIFSIVCHLDIFSIVCPLNIFSIVFVAWLYFL